MTKQNIEKKVFEINSAGITSEKNNISYENQISNMVNNLDPFANNLLGLLVDQAAKQHNDSNVIHISGEVVQAALNYDGKEFHEEFANKIENRLSQLGHISGIGIDEDNRKFWGMINFFKKWRIYLDNFELQIQINDDYREFFNEFITCIRLQSKSKKNSAKLDFPEKTKNVEK